MLVCTCFIQEGSVGPAAQASLEKELVAFAETQFQTAARFAWLKVARGSGYTAGEPSTTSILSVIAPRPLDQASRAPLLRQLCNLWAAEVGCSLDEVLAVLMDPAAD